MKKKENPLLTYISKYMTLSEEEKEAIADVDTFKTYKRGTILLREGQFSPDRYFIITGCIRCYYIIDGEEKTTAFYTESEPFAPMCSINKQPSEYYVSCVEDSVIALSNPELEEAAFSKFPRFETLCRILSEELLAKKQVSLDSFKTSSPEQRYLNLLQARPDLLQRIPQRQIASYLGVTPQSLSRIRKRLTE